jgi:putative transposase
MEERWLLKAASYVELNPVKAGMVRHAWDYPWSSVHAHLLGKDDFGLVVTNKLLDIVGDWKSYLLEAQSNSVEAFENHERTERPLGSERFLDMAESLLGRDLRKKKPGPKIKMIIKYCVPRIPESPQNPCVPRIPCPENLY